jgi:hypothetical protein
MNRRHTEGKGSPGTIEVRNATADDAEDILKCLREAFELYRQRYTPEGYLDTVLTPITLRQRLAAMTVLRPSGVVRDFFGMPLFEYVKALASKESR